MRKKVSLVLSFIVVTLIVTIGISFAYFTAQFTGGETTDTITVTGGSMNITYDGGPDINISNIIPDNNPTAVKTFTVTGNNTTEIPMGYRLSLIVESNNFSDGALKYKFIGTNTDNNGNIASDIDMEDLGTGSKNIKLGKGTFDVPTGGNKTHTYRLEIYFPNQTYNQNIDQEKTFKAHINIENYMPPQGPILYDVILAGEGGANAIKAKPTPNFNNINEPSGLFASVDEYGTSYYYRGGKNLNNNLIWGGFQWKIIRINGDGSVRLIYNGTEGEFNENKTVNDLGTNTQIGEVAWNTTNYNDAKYVGYMYGGTNGGYSTVRNGTGEFYEFPATKNETSNNMKTVLEAWYANNIKDKPFEKDVVDNLFCNDRQLRSEVGGAATGPGYGRPSITTHYAAYYRLNETKNPTLKCGLKNDRFTVNDTVIGNSALTYPIGLITADEAAMAGLKHYSSNDTPNDANYLYTNQNWLTFSPYFMYGNSDARIFIISATGYLSYISVPYERGTRPVISINGEVTVTGTGSTTDPFIIT